jgi:hypothetical protein
MEMPLKFVTGKIPKPFVANTVFINGFAWILLNVNPRWQPPEQWMIR